MSYNVDTWKTKSLKDLRIPLASFYKHARKDWHPKRTNQDDGTVRLICGECSDLHGRLNDGIMHVDSIEVHGEGSGVFLYWILEPALKDSTGELVAVRVWEGGDSIDRLTVKDGKVTTEPVDL